MLRDTLKRANSLENSLLRDRRGIVFAAMIAGGLILFRDAIRALVSLALSDARYTFTITIPLITICLIWFERKSVFVAPKYSSSAGALIIAGSAAIPFGLSVKILGLALVLVGSFFFCFGFDAVRRAAFPLMFLLLMVPIPAAAADQVVGALQKASADTTHQLFRWAGVPVFRESMFTFSLPGLKFEVAGECSGVRSGISLFISSLVAGYVLLKSAWGRTVLVLMTVPIVIVKNAIRIVTITLLTVYVDRGYMDSRLHHQGGVVFGLVGWALLAPILIELMRLERRRRAQVASGSAAPAVAV